EGGAGAMALAGGGEQTRGGPGRRPGERPVLRAGAAPPPPVPPAVPRLELRLRPARAAPSAPWAASAMVLRVRVLKAMPMPSPASTQATYEPASGAPVRADPKPAMPSASTIAEAATRRPRG